jgi:hypothetical protein
MTREDFHTALAALADGDGIVRIDRQELATRLGVTVKRAGRYLELLSMGDAIERVERGVYRLTGQPCRIPRCGAVSRRSPGRTIHPKIHSTGAKNEQGA